MNGVGKSICYAILNSPAVNTIYIRKTKGSIVIVISPLMKDQVRLFNQKGIRVHGVRTLGLGSDHDGKNVEEVVQGAESIKWTQPHISDFCPQC